MKAVVPFLPRNLKLHSPWGGNAAKKVRVELDRASDSGQRVQRISCSCEDTSGCCPRWLRWKKPWPKSCSGFHASRQEDLRGSGSSLHVSRRFESTPVVKRHRSTEPVRMSGRAIQTSDGNAGSHSTQGAGPPPECARWHTN